MDIDKKIEIAVSEILMVNRVNYLSKDTLTEILTRLTNAVVNNNDLLPRVRESLLPKLEKELTYLNERYAACEKDEHNYGMKQIRPMIQDCESRIKVITNSL